MGDVSAALEHFELRGRTRYCAELVDPRGLDVVDVGCSFGWFVRHALDRGATSVTGVDTSPESLAVAAGFAPEATLLEGSALALPVERECADFVAMFDVIEHVPAGTETAALSEAHRVLRPGGVFALTTPHHHLFTSLTDPAWYLGHRHYRLATLMSLVTSAGFTIRRVELRGRLFDQLDLLAYYVSRHVARREQHPFAGLRARADREWLGRQGRNTISIVAGRTG